MSRVCAALKNSLKPVSHVIFDMDGLLLDTETIYTQVTQNIIDEYDKVFTREIKSQVMGRHGHEVAQMLVELLDLPITPEEYMARAYEQQKILMSNAKLMPGVERFIKHLYNNKVPIAVATSSSLDSYNLKTKKHSEFFSMFNHTVTGGSDPMVKQGKPHPDIFLVCASRFPDKPHPEKCLVFEDAPNGLQAAKSAGMQCILIPDQAIIKPEDKEKATLVLKSMEDLQPEIFGLPAFTS